MSSEKRAEAAGPSSQAEADVLANLQHKEVVLRWGILGAICVLAFMVRLFAVIRYESVIHEFDPYFNYRVTQYIVKEGSYKFYNWFDDTTWYPLGRIIGATVYPGLMVTAAAMYRFLEFIAFPISVRNVCVFLAPFFASMTTLVAYFFGKQIRDEKAGLFAAAFISLVPGYISRSVAGSYDYEAVAIFAMNLTFLLFVKAVNSGSLFHGCLCSLAYTYMVFSWGGYIFIINLIPLYVLVMIFIGRYSNRLYVAYSCFYVLGTLCALQVRFVNFSAIHSSEHLLALLTFGFLNVYNGYFWLKSSLTEASLNKVKRFVVQGAVLSVLLLLAVIFLTGYSPSWTGRFYSLLDPTYARSNIPIIASVSEHQPTTWASFFFDLHVLVYLVPVGIYFCFKDIDDTPKSDGVAFLVLYGITSIYFSGVMVRLMLVVAPVACLLSGIGMSATMGNLISVMKGAERDEEEAEAAALAASSSGAAASGATSSSGASAKSSSSKKPGEMKPLMGRWLSLMLVVMLVLLCFMYVRHCVWVTSEAYSSPSIVMAAKTQTGRIIFDDYREAYSWLRNNTPLDAKVMSWWDYGYQLTAMANRTTLVDNNTWNNTHIATVGRAMASSEKDSYEVMKALDVDYVLVICGAMTGYASDDINKFLWMVRIASGVYPDVIQESNYMGSDGEYRVDKHGSETMFNSIMYKMCYYRFGEMQTEYSKPPGFDRVRQVEIGRKNFELDVLEEAYTTEHWMVRIYRVKKEDNRS